MRNDERRHATNHTHAPSVLCHIERVRVLYTWRNIRNVYMYREHAFATVFVVLYNSLENHGSLLVARLALAFLSASSDHEPLAHAHASTRQTDIIIIFEAADNHHHRHTQAHRNTRHTTRKHTPTIRYARWRTAASASVFVRCVGRHFDSPNTRAGWTSAR